jgi:phosphoribosylformylglycinamidine synthase
MAAAGGIGVTISESGTAALFGEDQARYLVACEFDAAEALMIAAGKAGVPIRTVGHFGGSDVTLDGNRAALEDLVAIYRTSFARAVA